MLFLQKRMLKNKPKKQFIACLKLYKTQQTMVQLLGAKRSKCSPYVFLKRIIPQTHTTTKTTKAIQPVSVPIKCHDPSVFKDIKLSSLGISFISKAGSEIEKPLKPPIIRTRIIRWYISGLLLKI